MNTLPSEIIELILHYLKHKDILTCLTVNRYFYSICIKHLYTEVHLNSEVSLSLFLNSIALFPQSQEAAKHVRLITTHPMVMSDKLIIQSNKPIDFLNSLTYLPNIRHLSISPTEDLTQALADTDKPILTKLENLSVYQFNNTIGYRLPDCYYRYRSSITTLKIYDTFLLITQFTAEQLVSYAASFPCLRHLVLNIKRPRMRRILNLADILKACPALVHFSYIGRSMNLRPLDPAQKFFIKKLRLGFIYMTVKDTQYIRDSLPQLKRLSLVLKSTTDDRSDIVGTVLQIKSLDTIRCTLPSARDMDTAARFFSEINSRSKQRNEIVINEANLNVKASQSLPLLYTAYHPDRGLRTANISIDFTKKSLGMFPVLTKLGQYLNKVDINGSNTAIDLECISRRCPVLSYLVLQHLSIIPHVGRLTVNNCLTNLTINSCSTKVSALKELTECYPKLKHLCFSDINIMGDDKNEIHYFHLNITSLKIKPSLFSGPVWGMMVIKAVDDVWVKSWLYNGGHQQEIIAEDIQTSSIKPIVDNPLYVFISNNVEDVSIH
ncbi:hypothetical protein BDB01DRAFT_803083 [Pilobolus umbonatus]|nr:hypothetical protein BDB01DRAFT_803083 [Pilobolus umbonatus]